MSEDNGPEIPHKWLFRALLALSGVMIVIGFPLGVLVAGQGHLLLAFGIYLAICLLLAVGTVSYFFTGLVQIEGEAA